MTPRRVDVSAGDGLQLAVREWPGPAGRAPLLCLPGICRTGLDFAELAERHAATRRVVALDYPGHGDSARAADPARYRPERVIGDVLATLAALGLHRPIILGTSFGGLLGMVLGTLRPTCLSGLVLNDIGPVIESGGLGAVHEFVATDPRLATTEAAVERIRRFMPHLSLQGEAEWTRMAELTFARGDDGLLHPRWDTRIAGPAVGGGKLPDLWPFFGALGHLPLFLAWGEASDILSARTVARMRAMRPDLTVASLPGIGHAPTLSEPSVQAALDRFLARLP